MLMKYREIFCFVLRRVQVVGYDTSVCETVNTIPKGAKEYLPVTWP